MTFYHYRVERVIFCLEGIKVGSQLKKIKLAARGWEGLYLLTAI